MKIVQAKEMSRIEHLAYEQGANEEAFMNRAGKGVAELIQQFVARSHIRPRITLICGSGNNAGDAYVAGAILKEGGFDVVALALAPMGKSSELCQLQSKRFAEKKGVIQYATSLADINLNGSNLIVDGILGTGFRGEVEGLYKDAIEKINSSNIPIISIDIPSGVNGSTGEIGGVCVKASITCFLGLPKTGCFIGEVWNHIGEIYCHNFGLDPSFIEQAEEDFYLIDEKMIAQYLPPIKRTQQKYEAGYVVGLGGSPGMAGAPTLASFAALRSGAGIVRLLHPKGMEPEFGGAPFEVIRQGYEDSKTVLTAMERAAALFIGPGIGTTPQSLKLLQEVLPAVDKPCVIDAEALSLLAQHDIKLPEMTVMTPHTGEMHRLLKLEEKLPVGELIKRCQEYSEEKKITLVLKGALTYIFHPGVKPHIDARGDPGMATAGSGDVLTGVIAAFLAQTKDPFCAAILGTHFHSIGGEIAAREHTSYCMVASDIIDALPSAFEEL
ncbi:MAG: Bifunctional NAD(P)H-hydrate repair enzyme Nnr [Chlamydiales bacterium]|nr:Bifunctional NAD(P)H-hydrate repair enzyme Nnr [Chlamydiales bacterium]MCH9619522.1 Bifunctional NAD(P)H-hydrate repair enzyme Nnr [Chlamydiales bacterium]MCH9623128.1 Bifunctional NAD(P)H-hydrate repair enzyme Nnr [Chlamydiales bacterium]